MFRKISADRKMNTRSQRKSVGPFESDPLARRNFVLPQFGSLVSRNWFPVSTMDLGKPTSEVAFHHDGG